MGFGFARRAGCCYRGEPGPPSTTDKVPVALFIGTREARRALWHKCFREKIAVLLRT
jgi:hypothetical protein